MDTVFTNILHDTDDLMPGHVGKIAEVFADRGRWRAPEFTGKTLGNHHYGSKAVDFGPCHLPASDQPGARGAK